MPKFIAFADRTERSVRLEHDSSGCKHEFLDGPQRTINNLLVGFCGACKREVAIELNAAKERTRKTWLVEYIAKAGK